MALIIGRKVGREVFIGEYTVKVTGILAPEYFLINVNGPGVNKQDIPITGARMEEIAPEVLMSAGIGTEDMARVIIKAPRRIKISRD